MSNKEKDTQKEQATVNNIDAVFGADAVLPIKTSLAFNSEARNNKDVHEVVIHASLAGMKIRDLLEKAGSQGAIAFQRPRRDAESNGVFKSREQFDKYVEDLGSEVRMHFNDLGKAPEKIKTPEEKVAEVEALLAGLPEEQRKAMLAKLG